MDSKPQGSHILEVNDDSYYDILANQKLTVRDICQHLTGPVISAVAHVILIALLSSIIVTRHVEQKDDLLVIMRDIEIIPPPEIPEQDIPDEQPDSDDVQVDIDRPQVDAGPIAEAPITNIEMNHSVLTLDVGDILGGDISLGDGIANLIPNTDETFKMRTTKGREITLKEYGVSLDTDTAVVKALKYFQKTQASDGSWERSPAMTGLAILCFLAHGETPNSKEFGVTVMKGIRRLVEYSKVKEKSQGNRFMAKSNRGYGHAIVTYALAEAYALTKIPMVKEAMNDMVAQIMEGMNKHGSYDYNFVQTVPAKDGHGTVGSVRSDLSLAGWCYQAMKAAFSSGCDVKGLKQAIERSIKGLKVTHRTKDGGFQYGGGAKGGGTRGKNTMTAVGALCLQLLGETKSTEAKMGVKWFEKHKFTYPAPHKDPKHKETQKRETLSYLVCDWEKAPANPLYQWYYMTQALFQASTTKSGSPKSWRKWNASFTKTLLENQNKNGSWDHPSIKNPRIHGHGPKKGVMPTALCTLMLEVYYRYLPTFKLHGGKHAVKSHKVIDDTKDLGITF